MIEVKNATLMNSSFSASLNKVCSMVWGRKTDEAVFGILDSVVERQNTLNKLYKKYFDDAKIDQDKPSKKSVVDFNANWEPILEDVSKIEGEKITLSVKEEAGLSGMDRYLLRELFDVVPAEDKKG